MKQTSEIHILVEQRQKDIKRYLRHRRISKGEKDDFQAPFSPMDRVKMTRYVVKPIISSAYKQCPFNSFFRAFRYSFIAEEFSKIPTFREELKYLLGDRRWSRIGARKYRENELLQQFFVLR